MPAPANLSDQPSSAQPLDFAPLKPVRSQRWTRIVLVAMMMYTISYIDRTNVSLALDPSISHMMSDLKMTDAMKGEAAGIFFVGYLLFQFPGGYLATRWSARKLIAILLVFWGVCAVGCGMVKTFKQFEVMRVMLGVAESGVFPAALVLLTHWFPLAERARANALFTLCMPLSIVFSSPITGWMLGRFGWHWMLGIEGALPFIWLPIWLYFISDHPRQAKWLPAKEREWVEATLDAEARRREGTKRASIGQVLAGAATMLLIMSVVYFLQNSAVYGCMTFFTEGLKGSPIGQSGIGYGILFAVPYAVTVVAMLLISRLSDKSGERRGYVALVYVISGVSLIASVLVKPYSFWASYVLLCLAIPGPFAALAPFWAIPAENLPKAVLGTSMGIVNAIGNLGGLAGNSIVGSLKQRTHGVTVPFTVLGAGLIVGAAMMFLLPGARRHEQAGFEVKPAGAE